jgi:hypothetical protein
MILASAASRSLTFFFLFSSIPLDLSLKHDNYMAINSLASHTTRHHIASCHYLRARMPLTHDLIHLPHDQAKHAHASSSQTPWIGLTESLGHFKCNSFSSAASDVLDILPSHAASHSAILASRLARLWPITRLHYTYLTYILPALKLKTTNAPNYMHTKIQMQIHDQDYELTRAPPLLPSPLMAR